MTSEPQYSHNILVFDSGIGGLSIVSHLRDQLPNVAIQYLADNALFPYGELNDDILISRVVELITTSCEQWRIDMVVVACNTASTLALPALRKKLSIPVVGVVPAIKPAAQRSSNKVIGLLATNGTVNRAYTDELIADFANDCEVIRVGSSTLVALIEAKMRGEDIPQQTYTEILAPLREHIGWDALDTVVLACTHFPLAQQQLCAAAPEVSHWIDSGEAIARRVQSLLQTLPKPAILNDQHAYFTDTKTVNDFLRQQLLRFGFKQALLWQLDQQSS